MNKILSLVLAISMLFTSISYAGDTSNLEAAWLMDEASGTRVDETANNNDLTDNNTVGQNASCQFDECADFERDNTEYLSITDGSQTGLDLVSDYSICYYANFETVTGITNSTVGKFASNSGYIATLDGNGDVGMRHDASQNRDTTTDLTNATWYHICHLYDDTANEMVVSIDGTLGSGETQNTNPTNNALDFEIGTTATGSDNLDALLDEVIIFSREITGSEVADLRDNGITSFISGVSARRRVIILMLTMFMGLVNLEYFDLYHINKHRTKFGLDRPWWMVAMFDWNKLFTIPEAYAAPPGVTEKNAVNTEFNSRDTEQSNYYTANGKYQQKAPVKVNGITFRTDAYTGPQGNGCVHVAEYTDGTKKYRMIRHTGPESRKVYTDWEYYLDVEA